MVIVFYFTLLKNLDTTTTIFLKNNRKYRELQKRCLLSCALNIQQIPLLSEYK